MNDGRLLRDTTLRNLLLTVCIIRNSTESSLDVSIREEERKGGNHGGAAGSFLRGKDIGGAAVQWFPFPASENFLEMQRMNKRASSSFVRARARVCDAFAENLYIATLYANTRPGNAIRAGRIRISNCGRKIRFAVALTRIYMLLSTADRKLAG